MPANAHFRAVERVTRLCDMHDDSLPAEMPTLACIATPPLLVVQPIG